MTSHDATERQDSNRQDASLDDRYGKIGISAVAAALRCQSDGRVSDDRWYRARERD